MEYLDKDEFENTNTFGIGIPNDAYAQYSIGNSYLNPLNEIGESAVFVANVTFEPGCRNNWHIHKASSEEVKYCSAQLVKVGIRKKAKIQSVLYLEQSLQSNLM